MAPKSKIGYELEGSLPAGSGSPSNSPADKQKAHQKSKKRTRSLGDSLTWIFRTNLPPRRRTALENANKREWFGFGEVLGVITNPSDTLNQLSETRRALRKAQRDLRLRASISSWYIPPHSYFFPSLPHAPVLQSIPLLQRQSESFAMDKIFSGPPSFSVLYGSTHVGKTTLLREVLKNEEKYFVLWLDLKILGGDGVGGLLLGLASALEMFLEETELDEGLDDQEFEKLCRAIKHERRFLSHAHQESSRLASNSNSNPLNAGTDITSYDVARLMQLFRSALLMYWTSSARNLLQTSKPSTTASSFRQPNLNSQDEEVSHVASEAISRQQPNSSSRRSEKWKSCSQIFHFKNFSRSHVVQSSTGHDSEETKVDHQLNGHTNEASGGAGEVAPASSDATNANTSKEHREVKNTVEFATTANEGEKFGVPIDEKEGKVMMGMPQEIAKEGGSSPERNPLCVRMPVIVFDDAQRLRALAGSGSSRPKSSQALLTLFDGLLVLSKQDKLCHVVHATNDGLYINWLRDLGLGASGELKIVTLADPSKSQTRDYFTQSLLPSVPPSLRSQMKLDKEFERKTLFERLYGLFGGRLTHWTNFMSDWVNAGGDLAVERGTPFLHAYTTLNFFLLRASEVEAEAEAEQGNAQINLDERDTLHLTRKSTHTRRQSLSRSRPRSRVKSRGISFLPSMHTGRRGMKSSTTLVTGIGLSGDASHTNTIGNEHEQEEETPPFTTMQLLDLMYYFTSSASSRPQEVDEQSYDRSHSVYFSRASSYFGSPLSMKTARPGLLRPVSTKSARLGKGFQAAARHDEQENCDKEVGINPVPYFVLCRELGSRDAVDFLVRSGIIELRWGECCSNSPYEEGREHKLAGKDEGVHFMDTDIGLGPSLIPASPILTYAMRIVLDEYGYQPAEADTFNPDPDADLEADVDAEVDLELEKGGRRNRDREADEADEEVDEDERDEFVDGEEYDTEYPASPSSIRGGGRYYTHSRSGHGHISGRESSGLSDDKSDYVSFIDDVSEY
ncbi:hypothetical protein ACEPAH_2996 [Sanghuangporus vaninii]